MEKRKLDKDQPYSYQKLRVWQQSVALAVEVYQESSKLPETERYGLASQMQRAVVSISSNIAEGQSRGGRKEFIQFLRIALGSAAELETQLLICRAIGNISTDSLLLKTDNIKRMLWGLIKKIDSTPTLSAHGKRQTANNSLKANY